MSSAIVTFPGGAAVQQPRKSRYEQGDRHYWRRRVNDFENDQRRKTCRCCQGTGEMWVYIDEPSEPCARCQRAYPGGDDLNESPF